MLILVAHGTRSTAGVQLVHDLSAAVARRIGPLRTAFVDVLRPGPAEVLAQSTEPAIVVPAFLASGYHVHADLPARIAESGHGDVSVRPALGPDPALGFVMHDRLRDAGWRPGDAVVMAAAGSLDPCARNDVEVAAELLAQHVGQKVHGGYIATGTPRVGDVVTRVRAAGRRVFIASYLLAPGLFHDRLADCGATAVAAPLGLHPGVVDLIANRFLAPKLHSTRESARRHHAGGNLGASERVAHVA
ncbi:MAG: sirohydrochlorin chelatase [Mycobacterium sp.]